MQSTGAGVRLVPAGQRSAGAPEGGNRVTYRRTVWFVGGGVILVGAMWAFGASPSVIGTAVLVGSMLLMHAGGHGAHGGIGGGSQHSRGPTPEPRQPRASSIERNRGHEDHQH